MLRTYPIGLLLLFLTPSLGLSQSPDQRTFDPVTSTGLATLDPYDACESATDAFARVECKLDLVWARMDASREPAPTAESVTTVCLKWNTMVKSPYTLRAAVKAEADANAGVEALGTGAKIWAALKALASAEIALENRIIVEPRHCWSWNWGAEGDEAGIPQEVQMLAETMSGAESLLVAAATPVNERLSSVTRSASGLGSVIRDGFGGGLHGFATGDPATRNQLSQFSGLMSGDIDLLNVPSTFFARLPQPCPLFRAISVTDAHINSFCDGRYNLTNLESARADFLADRRKASEALRAIRGVAGGLGQAWPAFDFGPRD